MALRMKVLAVQALTLRLLVSFNYQPDTAQSLREFPSDWSMGYEHACGYHLQAGVLCCL